jgi:hypothetical protein
MRRNGLWRHKRANLAFDRAMGSHYGASTPRPQGACIIEWNSHKYVTLSFVPVLRERLSWGWVEWASMLGGDEVTLK